MAEPIISLELLDGYLSRGRHTRVEMRRIRDAADAVYVSLTEGKKPRFGGPGELVSIVGPPGAGKTTLLHELLKTDGRPNHSIAFDPDLIRAQLPFFQETVDRHTRKGLDAREADARAMDKWYSAAVFATQSLLNRAQADGYNLVRSGTMSGTVTTDVCLRAKQAGYQLISAVVLAPKVVCRESIDRRMQQGGHPVRDDYIVWAFEEIMPSMRLLQRSSDRLQFFWRGTITSSPVFVAEVVSDRHLTIHDQSSFESVKQLTGIDISILTTEIPKRPSPTINSTHKTFS